MSVHLTKRIEVYCEDNQASVYVEQDKEFDSLDITISEVFAGGQEPTRISVPKGVAEYLIKALKESLEDL